MTTEQLAPQHAPQHATRAAAARELTGQMDQSASSTSSYTVSNDVLTAHLEDEAVLLHMDTKRYYRLNATAAAIWRGLEQGRTRADLLQELCHRFDVSEAQASPELDRVVLDLVDKGLLKPAAKSVGSRA